MMHPVRARVVAFLLPVMGACAHQVDRSGTLATLHQARPDTQEVPVDQGLDRAVQSYGDFLKQAPGSALAPEAMRRLADLKIEKEFGLQGDGKLVELSASESGAPGTGVAPGSGAALAAAASNLGRDPAAALHAPTVTKIDTRSGKRSHAAAPAAVASTVSASGGGR